jgi:hypothetical protein
LTPSPGGEGYNKVKMKMEEKNILVEAMHIIGAGTFKRLRIIKKCK